MCIIESFIKPFVFLPKPDRIHSKVEHNRKLVSSLPFKSLSSRKVRANHCCIYSSISNDEKINTFLSEIQYLEPEGLNQVKKVFELTNPSLHSISIAQLVSKLHMDSDSITACLLLLNTLHIKQYKASQSETISKSDSLHWIELHFGPTVKSLVEGESAVSQLAPVTQTLDSTQLNSAAINNSELTRELRQSSKDGFTFDDNQAESLRHMIIAMAEDWRVMVIKLCERVQTLRAIQMKVVSAEEDELNDEVNANKRIAREVLEIFAPLAHRLGMWNVKSELEQRAFVILMPVEYNQTLAVLKPVRDSLERAMSEARIALESALKRDLILSRAVETVKLTSRRKEIYSVWRKMCIAKKPIHQIYDLAALRIVLVPKSNGNESETANSTESIEETEHEALCYYALGVVHSVFAPFPGRVKDYIAFSKPNGYKALHTTVMAGSSYRTSLEVQIRTAKMHDVAERGMAAHWRFKSIHHNTTTISSSNNDSILEETATTTPNARKDRVFNRFSNASAHELRLIERNGSSGVEDWINTIREWKDEVYSSREFVDLVRTEILGNRVFFFVSTNGEFSSLTSQGTLGNGRRVMNMPRGSTVVDAAISVDLEIALKMVAARVNGRIVPISYTLNNTDMLVIICSKFSPGPESSWIEYAKTRRSKTLLKLYFREQQRKLRVERGYQILIEYLQLECQVSWQGKAELEMKLSHLCGIQSFDEIFLKLSKCKPFERDQLLDELGLHFQNSKHSSPIKVAKSHAFSIQNNTKQPSKLYSATDTNELVKVQLASCCLPVYGDSVCTLASEPPTSENTSVIVHRKDCQYCSRVQASGLIQTLYWKPNSVKGGNTSKEVNYYLARIKVVCEDRKGLLSDVSAAINRLRVVIESTQSATLEQSAILEYSLSVRNLKQLNSVIQSIQQVESVQKVERIGSSKLKT